MPGFAQGTREVRRNAAKVRRDGEWRSLASGIQKSKLPKDKPESKVQFA